ncbi:MAG: ADP-forming succinate--CoA ligase subunit beta [Bacteroidetes bacterium]|nr:ADP-forming succinate--CoA ligase subunit beta [Bacteroidota bacterium]
MKLLEYKAHELFSAYQLPCMNGKVTSSVEELKAMDGVISYPMVLKAQVQTGGRGKAGGIQFAENRRELEEKADFLYSLSIKNLPVEKVFAAEKVELTTEMYLGITLDRKQKQAVLIYSPEGGVDINEIAEENPDKLVKVHIPPNEGLQGFIINYVMDKSNMPQELRNDFIDICRKLYQIFNEYNCLLAEINPLVVTDAGRLLALDGKIDIDDNALFKHEDIRNFRDEITDNPLVLAARSFDFLYIPIQERGSIAVISNGSGMIMSSIDLISKHGMDVTCALDLGGGATADRIQEALQIVASNPKVETIFLNIFGGITRCDEIAKGILHSMDSMQKIWLVVRLEGTNKERGLEILEAVGAQVSQVEGLNDGVKILAQRLAK